MRKLTVGSLFSGVGGADLGFQRAGCVPLWMCEWNKDCRKLLADKFPGVTLYEDAKGLIDPKLKLAAPDVIIGGDPCPAHSNGTPKITGKGSISVHPDLSGYYLAVVRRLAPRWVVRENVPTPVTVDWFAVTLEALGYSTVVVWTNASDFIPQNRPRAFVIGCSSERALRSLPLATGHAGSHKASAKKEQAVRSLMASGEGSPYFKNYVWEESKRKFRHFHPDERDFIAGFPPAWTEGFPEGTRRRMCGNAVVPQVAEALASMIVKASAGIDRWPPPDEEAGKRRARSKVLA